MQEFWIAVAFLVFGLFLLLVELANPGFFIAVPGGTLILMGALGMVAPSWMFGTVGWVLWPVAGGLATVANLLAYRKWAPPEKAPITMSRDSLPGQTGVVERAIAPGAAGEVRVRGTTYSARSKVALAVGQDIRVTAVEGVFVVVEAA